MLEIDRLRLALPIGDARRAEAIARRVADRLSRQTWPGDLSLAHLAVPGVVVAPGASDDDLAAAITEALVAAVGRAAAGART